MTEDEIAAELRELREFIDGAQWSLSEFEQMNRARPAPVRNMVQTPEQAAKDRAAAEVLEKLLNSSQEELQRESLALEKPLTRNPK